MDLIAFLIDFILNVDQHLQTFVQNYGAWVYALLFLIIFTETGVVVMPFLPGDSLLFVVGALCGAGLMSLPLVMVLLVIAAILGDQTNYSATPSTRPTLSTSVTAASPSSSRASCLSSARSRPSWPVWPR